MFLSALLTALAGRWWMVNSESFLN
jgi:hypothetical protein